jgi:hypothetical protein
MVGALLLYGVLALVGWVGIGQRIYLAVCLLWLFALAWWIRSVSQKEKPAYENFLLTRHLWL